MNKDLVDITKANLVTLKESARADIVTCHFHNPFSGLYWLFHTHGVRSDWLMHGPLAHPAQENRFTCQCPSDCRFRDPAFLANSPNVRVVCDVFRAPLADELRKNVLARPCFSVREGVKENIRIHIYEDDPGGKNDFPGVGVFIFLSYRSPISEDPEALVRKLCDQLKYFAGCMLSLAKQPRLNENTAWRLRAVNISLRQKLGRILIGAANHKESESKLYEFIVQQPGKILAGNTDKRYSCTLGLLDVRNDLEIKDMCPRGAQPPKGHGIVDFVARSGSIVLIKNVRDYQARRQEAERNGEDLTSFPNYLECLPTTKSELAAPLIVQNKVVGVINLESDQIDGFDDGDALLLFQYCSSVSSAIRQMILWKELANTIEVQHDLLSANDDESVYEVVITAIEKMGFDHPAIVMFKKGKWEWFPQKLKGGALRQTPRSDGFTEHIKNNQVAVAMADIQPSGEKGEGPVNYTSWHEGSLSSDGLFEGWTPRDMKDAPNGQTHSQIIQLVTDEMRRDARNGVIAYTDLGFPIFASVGASSRQVVAVLWTKCRRFFRSILDDECWCLSAFCRAITDGLNLIERKRLAEGKIIGQALQYHFGTANAEIARQGLAKLGGPKYCEDLLVLEVDIRKSTVLAQKCSQFDLNSGPRSDLGRRYYSDILSEYQNRGSEAIIGAGGAFDQHAGDGLHAYFNIYTKALLGVSRTGQSDTPEACVPKAIKAFFEFVNGFRVWLEDRQKDPDETKHPVAIPAGLCIGGGLASGGAYVGQFSGGNLPRIFTAIGIVQNTANRLAQRARPDILSECIRNKNRNSNGMDYAVLRTSVGPEESWTMLRAQLNAIEKGKTIRGILVIDWSLFTGLRELQWPTGVSYFKVPLLEDGGYAMLAIELGKELV